MHCVRCRRRSRIIGTAILALGLLVLLLTGGAPFTTAPAAAVPGTTERVSAARAGSEPNGNSLAASISANGRFVAFRSAASNLVEGDTNGVYDVFVHDRQTGATERVSVASDGSQANGKSGEYGPRISADGRYVAFESLATNLAPNCGACHIFLHDRQTGNTSCVSVASDGSPANNVSWGPRISADGRFVAFTSWASNLVPGDTNGTHDSFIHDRQTGTTTRVSVASDGSQNSHSSVVHSISADGRFVALFAEDGNLVPGDTNGVVDSFVHDCQTGGTERISVPLDGSWGNGDSSIPAISGDGRFVAFESAASNMVPSCGTHQIFLRDRQTSTTSCVSVASDGSPANNSSYASATSEDGRFVVFHSPASNLATNDTNATDDIFVHDRQVGGTERLSVDSAANQANGWSRAPAISSDGRLVAFESDASNLVPGDTDGYTDIFVHDRQTGVTERVSGGAPSIGIAKAGPASVPATVGTCVDYTVAVTNNGSATATGVSVTDTLPQALRFGLANWSKTSPAGNGTCSLDGSKIGCAIGDLAPGGTVTVSLATTLRYIPPNGSVSNMACWSATNPAPTPGQNCATATTGVGGTPVSADLRVSKTGPFSVPAVPGEPVTYALQVVNAGPGEVSGVTVFDNIDRALGPVSAAWVNNSTGGSGSCDITAQRITCSIGTLVQLGSASIAIQAEVTKAWKGKVENWAYVYPVDANPQNNVALWITRFSEAHRKVVFVQGIDSESSCSDGLTFKKRVDWMMYYLTGLDHRGAWIREQYFALTPWTEDSEGDFRYFSYSGDYTCGDVPAPMAEYDPDDTCDGVGAAADRLHQLLEGLVGEDPDVSFDLITHSMGGLVAATWLVDHQGEDIVKRVNSVVTFDSPLKGLAELQWIALEELLTACRRLVPLPTGGFAWWPLQSMLDLRQSSDVVSAAQVARNLASFHTIDATASEIWVGGQLTQAVPSADTDFDGKPDQSFDVGHSDVWDWPITSPLTSPLWFVGCAVTDGPMCSQVVEEIESLETGEVYRIPVTSSPEGTMLAVGTTWGDSTVETVLEAPDNSVIGPDTQDPNVRHSADQGYEFYEIDHPQPGTWFIVVTGVDMPVGGENVVVSADILAPPPPDEDEDGVPDGEDNCQSVPNASQSDADADGDGDDCDPDADDDGPPNASDNCPYVSNPDQEDLDGDGLGEPCDGDNDNDLMLDATEDLYACLDSSVDDAASDSDTDGLVNLEEVWLGTDACSGDTDDDAFGDYEELHLGTDPLDDCPDDPSDDAWPFDNNIDTQSNVLDVLQYKGHLQICVPDPNYVQRLDINADDCVNVLDVLLYKGHLQMQCTNP
jgi:uncharacterized repeat protein (TIGR01451 family)